MRRLLILLFGVAFLSGCERSAPVQVVIESEPSVESLVATVLDGGGTFKDVDFATLIETSTGNRVLPLNPEDPVDSEIIEGIDRAIAAVVAELNKPGSPTHEESRINEVSSHFEEGLLEILDAAPEFECSLPRTAEGNLQRSGYPDLSLRHIESGRIIYLDPKLVAEGSLNSSLRTFYFTPRKETNKVLHDAHHLLVGIEHDGNTGAWKYLRWHLVDLTRFQVTLKAEFQASNRDLYLPELIVREGSAD
ncbi:MAG: hypothetical protein AAF491_08450 [Verrucomicrobiota bacterium]